MSQSVPSQAEFALQADSLVANLGGVPVLNGLSFGFRLGRWISVVGPNGAGKSSLLPAHALSTSLGWGRARPATMT